MKLIKLSLLAVYGMIRFLPFILSGYLIVSTKENDSSEKRFYQSPQKTISIIISMCLNVATFLGMHYWHYKDIHIIGYIKNVWGMNFYHQDVEYFTMSAVVGIAGAIVYGFGLRIFFCDSTERWRISRGQEMAMFVAGLAAFFLLMAGVRVSDYSHSKIQMVEVCSNNESYIAEGYTLPEDYIELENTGILPCQIDDLFLSDDAYDLQKKSLTGYVIPAGGLLVIPCIEDVDSFSIDKKGEIIYLSNGGGQILEQLEVGELDNDTAYIRVGMDEWKIAACTPGVLNDSVEEIVVEAPVLSHDSGFYDEEFELHMTASEDAIIYYTLDGSIPDEGSYIYENGIQVYDKSDEPNVWKSTRNVVQEWQSYEPDTTPVAKAFLVRAMAMDQVGNKSDIITATYFVGCEEFRDKSVVSLIASPEDLFSDDKGIYMTGTEYDDWYLNGQQGDMPFMNFVRQGKEWERKAVYELFEDAVSVSQQDVGIRIQGSSSRYKPEKRFTIYAREEYSGSDLLEEPLFGDEMQSHSIAFREGFIDAFCQDIMEDRDVAILRSKMISLFLNGEHWYNRFAREKYSTQYFESHYGIDKENLVFYKEGYLTEGVETDALLYNDLFSYVQEEDMTNPIVYEKLLEKMDVQSYIDFLCSNIYFANMDVDNKKNTLMWRTREVIDDNYQDGRWRWALYDMDALEWTDLSCYGVEESAAIDSFSQKPQYADIPYNQGILYMGVRQNPEFCKQFVLTFMDLMNTNFSVKTISEALENYDEDLTWSNSFFEKRPFYMKEYLAKEFELKGSVEKVTLQNTNEVGGTIQINTIRPKMDNGSWSGEYFTDYPISVTANPADGYEFVGWRGDSNSTEETIEIPVAEGGLTLIAEFREIK